MDQQGFGHEHDSREMLTMTPKRSEISVLFASPNSLTRELVMGALKRQKHFRAVATATTAQEVLEALQTTTVDVALIAATLRDGPMSGIGLLRQVRERWPEVKSVILFFDSEYTSIVDAFRAGARGVFCLSQSTFKLLCRCVEQVHAGQIWGNCAELSEVVEAFSQLAPMRVVNADGLRLLTKREEEVVRLVAEGMQNREIARELKLSEHTIKNYLFHIFEKLGVSSRVELVLYAVSNAKIVQPSVTPSEKREQKSAIKLRTRSKSSTIADQVSDASKSAHDSID